jgi:hypothetical protein
MSGALTVLKIYHQTATPSGNGATRMRRAPGRILMWPNERRATVTGARQLVADRAAAQLLPFQRCILAFFHTVASGL